MENIFGVTEYLRNVIRSEGGDPDRETLAYIKTKSGANYFEDSEGEPWRCYNFIPDSECYQLVEEPEQYGIDRDAVEVSIGTPETDENYKAAREQNQALLDEIHRYDRELLTPEQQDTYDIIEASSQLGLEMGADRFRYHGSYLQHLFRGA